HRPGYYDLVHSHYWLSGHVGWLAAQRWGVPLVHAMHTMAKVKNASLAAGDTPEPAARVIGETQIVAAADRL
ncbi:glycosyltransferase, partial [Streptomyces daliensis]|nr:glycosyltransferase [Streptomyces daliensis]